MAAIGSGRKRSLRSKRGGKTGKTSPIGISAGSLIYILFLIVLVGGTFGGMKYYYEIRTPRDYEALALEQVKSTGQQVLIASRTLSPNSSLQGVYTVVGLPFYAAPSDALNEMDIGKRLASGEIAPGTVLTMSNTYNPQEIDINENALDYLVSGLIDFEWLQSGDFIDVRLLRYNRETGRTDDLVVVAKKQITIDENRRFATLPLSEAEIALTRRADVEQRVAKLNPANSYAVDIYATVYREPGLQAPSKITYSGLNVVVKTPTGSMSLDDLLNQDIDIPTDQNWDLEVERDKEPVGSAEDITKETEEFVPTKANEPEEFEEYHEEVTEKETPGNG